MPINNSCLVNYIEQCSTSTITDQEIVQLAGAIEDIEVSDVPHTVACTACLPSAAENKGRLVFIEDSQTYRYSNGEAWNNCYDTSLTITGSELWVWGDNTAGSNGGMMGTGFNKYATGHCRYSSPVREFCSANDWCFIDVYDFGMGIKTDGTMFNWGGTNNMGQTGIGCASCICSPVQEYCSATNWCFGASGQGQIGIGLKTDGTLWGWGSKAQLFFVFGDHFAQAQCFPCQDCCSMTDVTCVATGSYAHTLITKTNGTLWGGGCNGMGELGINNATTDKNAHFIQEITSSTNWCGKPIAADTQKSGALKSDGTLWMWGRDYFGNLGNHNVNVCASSPVQEISGSTNWCVLGTEMTGLSGAIKTDGTLWTWGCSIYGSNWDNCGATTCYSSPIQEISSSTNWCTASVYMNRIQAIKTDGTLWVGGCNHCCYNSFALGGDFTCKSSPVQEITSFTAWCAVKTSQWSHSAGLVALTRGFNEPS